MKENRQNPCYQFLEQYLQGQLTIEDALNQIAVQDILAQFDDATIDRLNDNIQKLASQDLTQAIFLAVLNCQAARYRGSDATWGNCNSTLGWLYLQQDELPYALHHYQETLNVFESMPGAERMVAQTCLDLGEIMEYQGNFEAARMKYEKVVALAQQLGDTKFETDAWNGLGSIHLNLEQANKALVAFQCALDLSQKENDPRGEETTLGNLAQINFYLGRLDEAESYYRKAVVLSRKVEHLAGTGRHLSGLGSVLLELGELEEAEACLKESLDIARHHQDRRGEQQRLGNLGNLCQSKAAQETDQHQKEKRLLEAEQYHQDALAIACARNDPFGQADHQLNLGNVQSELGRFDTAQVCYKKALALTLPKEHKMMDTQWRIHYAWGKLHTRQQQDQLAFDRYKAAIEIVEQQRGQISIELRTKFWQEKTVLYKQMVLCCLRLDKLLGQDFLWLTLEYTERAKARYLADLLAQPQMGDTRKTIQKILNALPPHTAVIVFNVTEAGTVIFIVADQQPSQAKKNSSDDGWQQSAEGRIRAKLVDGFGRDDLQDLLVKVDASGEIIGGYLVDYYTDRNLWHQITLERVSTEIYNALLKSIHQELITLSVKRVVFMPNLGLSVLPLHACYKLNGLERDYFLDHYEITYVPSFDVLRYCQTQSDLEPPDAPNVFAVANPEKNLFWADFEVERITNLFQKGNVRVLDSNQKTQATPDAVTTELSKSNYTFAHFACHGNFDLRQPLKSALRLASSESLTLKMVMEDLKLSQTRMVVMSACETGLVDPGDLADEYIGLPAGFMKAGAPTVVSSLWVVDDLSTALLMERFYIYHLRGDPNRPGEGRLSPPIALRRAQQWLRDKATAKVVSDICFQKAKTLSEWEDLASELAEKAFIYKLMPPNSCPFAHPIFWAPFTISGQ